MVRIRLRRTGAKHQPSYRVVVADQRSPRDGRFIEIIGHYNPRTEPATMVVKAERALHWLGVGAQPSEAVQRILDKTGVTAKFEAVKAGTPIEEVLAEAQTVVEDEVVAEEIEAVAESETAEDADAAEEQDAPAAEEE